MGIAFIKCASSQRQCDGQPHSRHSPLTSNTCKVRSTEYIRYICDPKREDKCRIRGETRKRITKLFMALTAPSTKNDGAQFVHSISYYPKPKVYKKVDPYSPNGNSSILLIVVPICLLTPIYKVRTFNRFVISLPPISERSHLMKNAIREL